MNKCVMGRPILQVLLDGLTTCRPTLPSSGGDSVQGLGGRGRRVSAEKITVLLRINCSNVMQCNVNMNKIKVPPYSGSTVQKLTKNEIESAL